MIGRGATITVYDSNMLISSSFSSIGCNGIAWDFTSDKLWVISGNQIASYSISGVVIDSPMSIAAKSYRGLTFDGNNLWTTVVADTAVYCLSSIDGSLISSFNIPFIDGSENAYSSSWGGYNFGRDIIWNRSGGYLIIYHCTNGWQRIRNYSTTGDVLSVFYSLNCWNGASYLANFNRKSVGYPDYIYTSSYIDIVDKDNYTLPRSTSNGDTLATVRVDGMGSRVLLPNTITKTDQQTLRITYQFNYN